MTAGDVLQEWACSEETSQGVSPNAKAIARDLHDRAMRISRETYERGAAAKALVTDDSDLNSFAFPSNHYERDQAAVREVYEFEFVSGLVQAGVAGEVFKTEQRPHGLKFTIRKTQKNSVADRASLKVCAFASQQRSGLRSGLRIGSELRRTERLLVVHRSKMHITQQRMYLPQDHSREDFARPQSASSATAIL
jgi:hypothetical protein